MSVKKRVIYLCILAVEVVAFCILKITYDNINGDKKETGDMIYVSLGDSIARGFGLDDLENERYSSLIAAEENIMSDSKGKNNITAYNYGVDGQTSGELLEHITEGRTEMVAEADVISICIGTNDVLYPAEMFFMKYDDLFYNYGAAGSYGNGQFDYETDARIKQGFDTYDAKEFEADYEAMLADCQTGLEDLRVNLTEVISVIKEINPQCQIICLTLYNPYAPFDYTIYTDNTMVNISEYSENLMEEANAVIAETCEEMGCMTADVHGAFAASDVDVLNSEVTVYGLNLDDHPNAAGHRLIADTILDVIGAQ